jgi:UDP-N-acetyl-D-glucosamine dehydrogenase
MSYNSLELIDENLKKMDITVIITDHSIFDYEFIAKYSQQILDTRNVYKKSTNFEGKIWKL